MNRIVVQCQWSAVGACYGAVLGQQRALICGRLGLQELAVSLLRTKVEYAQVWQLFQPYLGNLPSEEDVYTLYNFRQEHIALLQDAEMVSRIHGRLCNKRVIQVNAYVDRSLQGTGCAGQLALMQCGLVYGCVCESASRAPRTETGRCSIRQELAFPLASPHDALAENLQEGKVKQALDLVESIYSGTSKEARATMADLRQLRPEEAALITLGELKRYASIVRRLST